MIRNNGRLNCLSGNLKKKSGTLAVSGFFKTNSTQFLSGSFRGTWNELEIYKL